jgi:hypothetical protein
MASLLRDSIDDVRQSLRRRGRERTPARETTRRATRNPR